MSAIQIQTPPAAEPVSLPTLKNHLRVTISEDDELIKLYLQSARETVESDSGRSLVNKLYRQSHDHFPRLHDFGDFGTGYFYQAPRYARGHHYDERQQIKLLRCPLVNVQKIVYVGTDQQSHTLLPAPAAWLAKNEYDIGNQIVDPNGNLQQVSAVTETETGNESESGATVPSWNATPAGTTADGDLTWTNMGVAPAGDFLEDNDSEPPRLYPAYGTFWPETLRVPNAVQIFFTAGYGNDGAAAPANLKVAVMLATGVSYENREAVTLDQLHDLDWYERLIWSERVLDFAPTK
jgi:hypothetical protein